MPLVAGLRVDSFLQPALVQRDPFQLWDSHALCTLPLALDAQEPAELPLQSEHLQHYLANHTVHGPLVSDCTANAMNRHIQDSMPQVELLPNILDVWEDDTSLHCHCTAILLDLLSNPQLCMDPGSQHSLDWHKQHTQIGRFHHWYHILGHCFHSSPKIKLQEILII